jgi:hypothetical protein
VTGRIVRFTLLLGGTARYSTSEIFLRWSDRQRLLPMKRFVEIEECNP